MSTLMAGRVTVDGALPRPPAHGLMTVAEDVTAQRAAARGGAVVLPYPGGTMVSYDPCDADGSPGKDVPDPLDILDAFPAFDAYLGEICTAYNIGDWDEWRARANQAFLARENWALERQLVDASFVNAPSLGSVASANSAIFGSSLAAPTAVAMLEAYLADIGIEGTIHLTPSVVTYLGFSHFRRDGEILRTAAGTPVIVGTGYHGAVGPGSEADAGDGQSWIYASGRPQFAREGQVFSAPEDISEALDRDDNTVLYRAERGLWVGWDGQLAAAVLADWSPT